MLKISYSAAQRYLLSPMSYFLHYYMRLRPIDEGSALAFGAAMDEGLNHLLQSKKDGKAIDNQAVISAKAAFDKEFSKYNPKQIKYTKADADETSLSDNFIQPDDGLSIAYHCLKHKAYILIEEYASQVMPKIKEVYLIQHNIALKNDLGDEFTGKIDFIAKWENDKIYIIDNKTSTVKYADDAVSNSEQLATYYEAMRDEYDLDGALYIVIPKKIRKRKLPRIDIKFIFGEIDEKIIDKTFKDYEYVLKGVKNAQFKCTPSKCCSQPWGCTYENYCRSGGTDTTGLKIINKT